VNPYTISDEELDELERRLHEQLVRAQQDYRRITEPIILELIRLDDLRPHRKQAIILQAIDAGVYGPIKTGGA
jgi:hypothetical protein